MSGSSMVEIPVAQKAHPFVPLCNGFSVSEDVFAEIESDVGAFVLHIHTVRQTRDTGCRFESCISWDYTSWRMFPFDVT